MTDRQPECAQPSSEYSQQLDHMVVLATSAGWREYVKGRLDELEADRSGAWAGIRADLNAAIEKLKEQRA